MRVTIFIMSDLWRPSSRKRILCLMEISGLTSLVTGASRRIGRTISLALAEAGSNLVIHYHNSSSEAEALAGEIRSMGRKVWLSRHNLADSEATSDWFESISGKVGGIDILVNSASEYLKDSYENLNPEKLCRSMALHLCSPVAMIRSMQQSGRVGTIVNILDTRVVSGDMAHVSYHLGKSALFTATSELALKMAPKLRINAVAPGIILPPEGQDESWLERLKTTTPLQVYGNPRDVADAVLYLCRADFVTGQTLFVDGGRHLKGMRHEL